MANPVRIRMLAEALFCDPLQRVYALLDGASIPELLAQIHGDDPEFCCLYRGELPQDVEETAPYLVKLEREHPFTTWVLQEGWGRHWGIFARSRSDFRTMRKHFRTFLMVYRHDGKPLYFRYYDPRVLRAFLPIAKADQIKTLFGPVECYLMEDKDPGNLLRFRSEEGVIVREEVKLPMDTPEVAFVERR